MDKRIWLYASNIPSKENVVADRASRVNNIVMEWELDNFAYQEIVHVYGKPNIDLLASRINKNMNAIAHGIKIQQLSWSMHLLFHGLIDTFTPSHHSR